MKTCIIFGAAEGLPKTFKKQESNLLIAADAGICTLERFGVIPDIAVGDFDSLGFVPKHCEVIRHPAVKDDTDSMLAVKTGLARGYRRFILYGCAGGRPDHLMANYQLLAYVAKQGGIGLLCMTGFTASVFTGKAIFSKQAKGTVSLFALGDQAIVSGSKLLYPLNNTILQCHFPLGQSNEFTGEESVITIQTGLVLAIWQGNENLLLKYMPDFLRK